MVGGGIAKGVEEKGIVGFFLFFLFFLFSFFFFFLFFSFFFFLQPCDLHCNLFCLLLLTVSQGTSLGEIDWYLQLSHFLAEWLPFFA